MKYLIISLFFLLGGIQIASSADLVEEDTRAYIVEACSAFEKMSTTLSCMQKGNIPKDCPVIDDSLRLNPIVFTLQAEGVFCASDFKNYCVQGEPKDSCQKRYIVEFAECHTKQVESAKERFCSEPIPTGEGLK